MTTKTEILRGSRLGLSAASGVCMEPMFREPTQSNSRWWWQWWPRWSSKRRFYPDT